MMSRGELYEYHRRNRHAGDFLSALWVGITAVGGMTVSVSAGNMIVR
jgi:hypothetical protein